MLRILGAAILLCAPAFPYDWLPVNPEELALQTPRIDRDTDAEVMLWDVRISDEISRLSFTRLGFTHYVRIKIYNQRGVESQSTVDLTWAGKSRILDIEARTIKPDGTIIKLDKDAIFTKTIAKSRDIKMKGKSFTLPSVEPGSIIEYQYKEFRDDQWAHMLRLDFQRDLPSWHVRYHLKPAPGFVMQGQPFQAGHAKFQPEPGGYYMTEQRDIPAFKQEPRMPPEAAVRPWLLIYYTRTRTGIQNESDVAKEWNRLSKELHKSFKDEAKVKGDIKKAVPSIIGDAATPEEKLNRLAVSVARKSRASSMTASDSRKTSRSSMSRSARKDTRRPTPSSSAWATLEISILCSRCSP